MKTLDIIITLLFTFILLTISVTFTNEYKSGFAITITLFSYFAWIAYSCEKKEKKNV